MRKNGLLCCALACAFWCFLVPALAEAAVIDEAGLLTARQEAELTEKIGDIREDYGIDVVILLKKNIGGKTARMYAADYYDDHGYGVGEDRDGMIFLLAMAEREYFTSTSGRAIDLFPVRTLDGIHADITPYLTRAEYDTAFLRYLAQVRSVLQSAGEDASREGGLSALSHVFRNASAFDRANRALPVILVVALVIAFAVALSLKAQMKTVRRKNTANSYVKDGSFNLTRVQDIYLYTTETRRKIETRPPPGGHEGGDTYHEGGTYHSSSGHTHGGAGGRF